jgi:hypothetical protein
MNDGFDPRTIASPLYVLDPQTLVYRPLDATTYDDIIAGRLKL